MGCEAVIAMTSIERIRPAAVAGAFYPDNPRILRRMIAEQLDYARGLLTPEVLARLPEGAPKAVIVPHAGYVYSGTTAALAYALLQRGRGTIRRAVIVGPTHRVAVRGVACSTAAAFSTPLGVVPVDVDGERAALGMSSDGGPLRSGMSASADAPAPAMIVNDPTHEREHAVEVQIPFLQTVLGSDLTIVPLNAGDATPREVGDVLRALWGGSETVIVISSDLSHYHPEAYARQLDDATIEAIAHPQKPIHPRRACGAYPINGLLNVLVAGLAVGLQSRADQPGRPIQPGRRDAGAAVGVDRVAGADRAAGIVHDDGNERCAEPGCEPSFDLRLLGRSTSGDDGVVALAGQPRPAMSNPDEPVVGYASFAVWQHAAGTDSDAATVGKQPASERSADRQTATAAGSAETETGPQSDTGAGVETGTEAEQRGDVLLNLARASIREHLGIDEPSDDTVEAIIARHPWLREPGASFVTLTENGRLRGCIGTLEAYRSLGDDVADHAVDAASRDPRFNPVTAAEYPLIDVEVSVLGKPESIEVVTPRWRHGDDGMKAGEPEVQPAQSRNELERALRPGRDGLILEERGGRHRRATFLPQVWEQLPNPHDFVSHLLAKAGLPANLDWSDGEIECERYEVTAYAER